MDIILKSGYIIKDVKSKDSTKNPIALWIWSQNQARDNILAFDKVSILGSQIAAILDDKTYPNSSLKEAVKQIENKPIYEKSISEIGDDDLPF